MFCRLTHVKFPSPAFVFSRVPSVIHEMLSVEKSTLLQHLSTVLGYTCHCFSTVLLYNQILSTFSSCLFFYLYTILVASFPVPSVSVESQFQCGIFVVILTYTQFMRRDSFAVLLLSKGAKNVFLPRHT
jgi:hypothetical protein